MDFTRVYESTPFESGDPGEKSLHWNDGSSPIWYVGHNNEKKILTPIVIVRGPGSQNQNVPSVHFTLLPESLKGDWSKGGPSSVSHHWENQRQREAEVKEATGGSVVIPEEANPFSVNFKKGISIGGSHVGMGQVDQVVEIVGPSSLPGYVIVTGGQNTGRAPAVLIMNPGMDRGNPRWPRGNGGNPNPGGNLNPGGNPNPRGNPNPGWPSGLRGLLNNSNPGGNPGPGGPPGNPNAGGAKWA
ncbi:hypothetical protein C8J56DRAFT_884065 [Mycena floridula]|nr:hypothetical protein C8J56DRAFT_884065 [Mycena floridula]